jgi:long-subunit fatty acid transport protein
MKKLALLVVTALCMSNLIAQTATDALLYAQDETQGTARFRALSGAFGALGGDLSAISINPAGAAIFSRSHASFSLSSLNKNNTTSFLTATNSSSDSKIDINQAGATFIFKSNNSSSAWNKFVFSVAYDKTANYDNKWTASGQNNKSIDRYFLEYANGLRLDEISAFEDETISEAYADIGAFYGYGNQQAFLGYESFILEPDSDSDDNTLYTSNIADGNFNQRYDYIATGYNGKFSFNAATQYGDKLYLGLNLNTHFINYERFTFLDESNSNEGSFVTNVGFQNNLLTRGNGFSFQLGAILKLTTALRAGFTYNSPTWFTILEETSQNISTVQNDNLGSSSIFINPNIINIFPSYRLQSPSKITGSLAYVFGTQGLISFDYSRRDYSNTKFKPTSDAFFASQNIAINDLFTSSNTYRVGGEYIIKKISLRGGYRFEESPYADKSFDGDLTGYSFGLGYNLGNLKLDLTYDQSQRNSLSQLYAVGLTDSAVLDTKNSNITLSLGFNL